MPLARDVIFAVVVSLMLLVVTLSFGGCDKSPPLPPELPLPRADLMVSPAATPIPTLPENKALKISALYAHAATVQGQCVMDRARLDHLQQYVSKLTKRK